MPKSTREAVYAAIWGELNYQEKWRELDKINMLPDFLTYLWKYYRKAEDTNAINLSQTQHVMRKIAALGFSAMKLFGIAWRIVPITNNSSLDSIKAAINEERKYQDNLRKSRCTGSTGGENGNTIEKNPLTIGCYLTMIRHYLTVADSSWTLNPGDDTSLADVRKITAVAVRCMEEHGAALRADEAIQCAR